MKDLNTNASISAIGEPHLGYTGYKGSAISQISKGSMYTGNGDIQLVP